MQKEWDAIADAWDEHRTTTSSTLPLFLPHLQGIILDAGCGNGRNAREMAKNAATVMALDASAAMLEKAKKNLEGLKNIQIIHAGMQEIPVADRRVEAVVCLAAFHHLRPAEQPAALAEFFRVLKTRGVLCLTVWNRQQRRFKNGSKERDVPWDGRPRYYYFFDEGELTALLQAAGFRVEEIFYEKNGQSVVPAEGQNLCLVARKP